MRKRTSLPSVGAVLLATGLLLGSCSASNDAKSSDGAAFDSVSDSVAEADRVAAAEFNDADVTFAQNMIPHHTQAVEMAVLALDDSRGASSAVKELATRIKGAQQPEIDLMTGWLTSWGKEVKPAGMDHSGMKGMEGMEGMDHSGMEGMEGMAGMMSAEDMKKLSAATGTAFDTSWFEMMIEHHEGAVTMAKAVQASGKNADVMALADRIITAQEAEIAEMTSALK